MQTIQLAITDPAYEAALRDALARSGPWHVESVETPRPGERCVLVMDEASLSRVPLPLPYPERVVLLTRKDPTNLSHAWEAGIVSLVSPDDPPSTVLLAIMAAALRVPKSQPAAVLGGNSPSRPVSAAPLSPEATLVGAKRYKPQ
ncbi:MAG TPA: hypothetical protein VMI94_00015 [Bryobacteraceae bacterium]|nr:hypothetical protein [Bryobacteraceae bacterium]